MSRLRYRHLVRMLVTAVAVLVLSGQASTVRAQWPGPGPTDGGPCLACYAPGAGVPESPSTGHDTTPTSRWPSFSYEPESSNHQRGTTGIYSCYGAGLNLRNCGP
jgi:hypothetical protein